MKESTVMPESGGRGCAEPLVNEGFCNGRRDTDERMAVLLVDALLNLNRNPNRNPLTADCRPHIRPVPHEYDQR